MWNHYLDVGDEVGVGGDGVLDVPLTQVPDLAAVVLTGGDDVVTIRGPVSSRHPLEIIIIIIIITIIIITCPDSRA